MPADAMSFVLRCRNARTRRWKQLNWRFASEQEAYNWAAVMRQSVRVPFRVDGSRQRPNSVFDGTRCYPHRLPSRERAKAVSPPGEFIRDELEARGWSQGDLARIMGRPLRAVGELIAGKQPMTPETARGLAVALGDGDPLYWMNLDRTYRANR